jgi:uncharacterized protein YraI
MRKLVGTMLAGLAVGLAASPPAQAQSQAFTSTTVNLYAGPAGDYPVVAQVPGGVSLAVMGCVAGYSWCDVTMPGLRGWVYGGYLTYPYQGSSVPLLTYGARIGLPVVTFSIGAYWGSYYRDRPWYGNQSHWIRHPPPRPAPPPRPGPRPPGHGGKPPPGGGHGHNGGRPPGGGPGAGSGGRPPPNAGPGGRPPGAQPGPGGGRPPSGGHGGRPPGGGGGGGGGRPPGGGGQGGGGGGGPRPPGGG